MLVTVALIVGALPGAPKSSVVLQEVRDSC